MYNNNSAENISPKCFCKLFKSKAKYFLQRIQGMIEKFDMCKILNQWNDELKFSYGYQGNLVFYQFYLERYLNV